MSLLISLLILLGAAVKTEWELPFHFPKEFLLRVIGGYPSLIDSVFDEISDPPPNQLIVPTINRYIQQLTPDAPTSPFNCSLLLSSQLLCVSTVSILSCTLSTALSIDFWAGMPELRCEKGGRTVDCSEHEIKRTSDYCNNVVTRVTGYGTNTRLSLADLRMNTLVTQTIDEGQPTNCSQYSIGEEIRTDSEKNQTLIEEVASSSSVLCGDGKSDALRFMTNSSRECRVEYSQRTQDCETQREALKQFWTSRFPFKFLCNCDNCDVPFIWSSDPVSSNECALPTALKVVVTVKNGSVTGAMARLLWKTQRTTINGMILKTEVRFYEATATTDTPRFWHQPGLFRCPSENRCPSELLYPFYQLHHYNLKWSLIIALLALLAPIVYISCRKSNNLRVKQMLTTESTEH